MAGKFNRGGFDLIHRSLPTNRILVPGSSISGWFKLNVDINSEPVLVSSNGLRLMRNNNKIALQCHALYQAPIFWSKLGSSAEVSNPEIGLALTENGTISYTQEGKFGGALASTYGTSSRLTTDITPYWKNIGLEPGCVEYWWCPGAGWPLGEEWQFLFYEPVDGKMLLGISYVAGSNLVRFYASRWGAPASYADISVPSSNFSIGTWYHMAGVWDNRGIDGTNHTFRFYVDGICAGASTRVMDVFDWDNAAIHAIAGSSRYPHSIGGKLDNIKFWNYAKADFSDRHIEDATSFICGDNGITLPEDNEYHHYALRINQDKTYTLFLDGVREYSSTVKIFDECFIDWEGRLKPDHWYQFEETTGTVLYDTGVVGGKNATSSALALGVSGRHGRCIEGNGTVKYGYIGSFDPVGGTQEFTISIWVYHDVDTHQYIVGGDTNYTWLIGTSATTPGVVSLWLGNGSGWSQANDVEGSTILTSGWHLVTFTRKGDTFKVYCDGLLKITFTSSSGYSVPVSAITYFHTFAGIPSYWDGKSDDLRIWGRPLPTEEVWRLYNLTKTYFLPNVNVNIGDCLTGRLATPLHYFPLNERSGVTAFDYGTAAKDATYDSSVTLGRESLLGRCPYFNGIAGSAKLRGTHAFPTGVNNPSYTVAVWARVYNRVEVGADPMLLYIGNAGVNYAGIGIGYYLSQVFHTWRGDDQTIPISVVSTATGWHHIVGTYDSSTDKRRIYYDGQLYGEDTPASNLSIGSNTLIIGSRTASELHTKGNIQDVFINNFAITEEEVRQLYVGGRTPYGAVSDLRIDTPALSDAEILKLAGHATDTTQDQGEEHVVESSYPEVDVGTYLLPDHWWTLDTVGGLVDSGKFGGFGGIELILYTYWGQYPSDYTGKVGECYYLWANPDTGAYLRSTSGGLASLLLENRQCTLSIWACADSLSSTQVLFGFVSDDIGYCLMIAGGEFQFVYNYPDDELVSTTPLSINTWYNIVISCDGSVLRLYINGQLQSSVVGTLKNTTSESPSLYIGRRNDSSDPYTGFIDDFRIYVDRCLTGKDIELLYNHTNNYKRLS